MDVNVVVTNDGTLKVKNDADWSGKEFYISANDISVEIENKSSNAAEILELFKQAIKWISQEKRMMN